MSGRTKDDGQLIAEALRDADYISGRIAVGRYRGNLSDVETLRNHVRALAAALERKASA
jgi:hypothetical protein